MTEKLCWSCCHLEWDPGGRGYSEYTPGWAWSADCRKDKWAMSGSVIDLAEFRSNLERARTCEHFADREEPDNAD